MNRAAVAAHPAKDIIAVTDAPSPAEMPANPEIKKKGGADHQRPPFNRQKTMKLYDTGHYKQFDPKVHHDLAAGVP